MIGLDSPNIFVSVSVEENDLAKSPNYFYYSVVVEFEFFDETPNRNPAL